MLSTDFAIPVSVLRLTLVCLFKKYSLVLVVLRHSGGYNLGRRCHCWTSPSLSCSVVLVDFVWHIRVVPQFPDGGQLNDLPHALIFSVSGILMLHQIHR